MAMLSIGEYIDIGTGGTHDSTSWQFFKDENYTELIDESLNDTVNLVKWHSPLPMRPEDGTGYYKDLPMLYGRAKVVVGGVESEWFNLPAQTQQYQEVTITENDKDDILTNSRELNWWGTKTEETEGEQS